jgi:hypothetical protein
MPAGGTAAAIVRAGPDDLPAIAALNREMAARVPAWASEEYFRSLVTWRAQQAAFLLLRHDNAL